MSKAKYIKFGIYEVDGRYKVIPSLLWEDQKFRYFDTWIEAEKYCDKCYNHAVEKIKELFYFDDDTELRYCKDDKLVSKNGAGIRIGSGKLIRFSHSLLCFTLRFEIIPSIIKYAAIRDDDDLPLFRAKIRDDEKLPLFRAQ